MFFNYKSNKILINEYPAYRRCWLPSDPIKDFSAVACIAGIPNVVVVHPSIPVKSVNELVVGIVQVTVMGMNFRDGLELAGKLRPRAG